MCAKSVRYGSWHTARNCDKDQNDPNVVKCANCVRGKSLIIKVAHHTNGLKISDFEIRFEHDVPTLAAGDWNSKHKDWNNKHNCTSGNAVVEIAQKLNLEINGPTSPTHCPSNGGTRKQD